MLILLLVPRGGMVPRHYNQYKLEAYRQVCESARTYATGRFSNLSAFLTYMSILVAAVVLSGNMLGEHKTSPTAFYMVGTAVSLLGCIIGVLFLALEVRHHHWWIHYEQVARRMEQSMGLDAFAGLDYGDGNRHWIRRGFLGLSATRATYGIYIVSVVFFLTAFCIFLNIAGIVSLSFIQSFLQALHLR